MQAQVEAAPIQVLIVDDHPMVREGLAGVLERQNMKIVGLAATGKQAVEMYSAHRPDVVLLDLRLPDQSGFEVVRTMLDNDPQARDHYPELGSGRCFDLQRDQLGRARISAERH